MPAQVRVIWDDEFTNYDFGPTHPMAPVRLDLTARLCVELGLFDAPGVEVVGAKVADDALIATVHEPAYVAAVRRASLDPAQADQARGLGTTDDPAFVGIHESSARIVQGTVDLAEAIWTGAAEHGVNFCGGLHHAMPGYASGFCVYNDIAAGIRWLLDHGAKKVAYIDVDVHHGDGVQAIFWDDPRVLTLSMHESGRMLFPGTGDPGDIGVGGGLGCAVNVALPPGTSDAGWLRAFHSVAPALIRDFAPDVLVTQHGCDSHFLDPLAHLEVSVDAQRTVQQTLHDLEQAGCSVILVLCTGVFRGLRTRRAWLVQPDRILPGLVSGLAGARRVGVVMPLSLPVDGERRKWSPLQIPPSFAVASPYEDGDDQVSAAARDLVRAGANLLVMDCFGFTDRHRNAASQAAGVPVLLSSELVARVTGACLHGD